MIICLCVIILFCFIETLRNEKNDFSDSDCELVHDIMACWRFIAADERFIHHFLEESLSDMLTHFVVSTNHLDILRNIFSIFQSMMHSDWDAVFPLMDTFHGKIRAFSHVHDVALVHVDVISHLQEHIDHLTDQHLEDIKNIFVQGVDRINSRSDAELFAKAVRVMNKSSALFENTLGSGSLSKVFEAILRVWPNASSEHRNTLLHVGVEIIESFLSKEHNHEYVETDAVRDNILSFVGSLCLSIWKEINSTMLLTPSSPLVSSNFLYKMPLVVKMWKFGFSMDGINMKTFENVDHLRVIFDHLLRIVQDPATEGQTLVLAVDIVHGAQRRGILALPTRLFFNV
jgi:hypothetical protein